MRYTAKDDQKADGKQSELEEETTDIHDIVFLLKPKMIFETLFSACGFRVVPGKVGASPRITADGCGAGKIDETCGLVQHSHRVGGSREKSSSSKAGNWEKESSKGTGSPGGECALGTGRALASRSPRCSRILRITLGSSMEAMTPIRFRHRGQTKGSVHLPDQTGPVPLLFPCIEIRLEHRRNRFLGFPFPLSAPEGIRIGP
jgi:hypothetical protein